MVQVTLEEAATRLPQLVEKATAGEEIFLLIDNAPVVKLTPIPIEQEVKSARPRPQFGSAKGMIWMSPDFDEPLEDFKEYME